MFNLVQGFLFILFLALSFPHSSFAADALPVSCLQQPSAMLCAPSSQKNPAKDACELELKTAQCDEYVKLHPELKNSNKLRVCDAITVCDDPAKANGFIKSCAQPALNAMWDGVVGIYAILSGEMGIPSEQDLAKMDFFKNCTTATCKRQMLGPFASYFTKEEIEGHRDRNDLNPNDVANKNYLEGYSAMVLYRKLLLKLKKDSQVRGMSEKFIEPWSGKAARTPLSLNELIDKVLTDSGINNTTCIKPEVVLQMRCYALGTLVDPTLVLGAGFKLARMAGLAAKEVVVTEKLVDIGADSVKVAKVEDALIDAAPKKDTQIYLWENRESGNHQLADNLEKDLEYEYQKAPVKKSEPIPFLEGVTGGSYVEFADGTKGVWKPDLEGSIAGEVAAYKIDKHLGLNRVPITVRKKFNGKDGSFQLWVKKTEESTVNDPGTFAFFDYLIGNSDRHAGNYLIVDGRAVAIDNGFAFRQQAGVVDFPRHVDEIIARHKDLEKVVAKQRAELDRARRGGVGNRQLTKMESELNKAEKNLDMEKTKAAEEIGGLGVNKTATAKLKDTSNAEWNKMMEGIDKPERANFFFRKQMAEAAIERAQKYFGNSIYPDSGKPVKFKKPEPLKEKNPYLEEIGFGVPLDR